MRRHACSSGQSFALSLGFFWPYHKPEPQLTLNSYTGNIDPSSDDYLTGFLSLNCAGPCNGSYDNVSVNQWGLEPITTLSISAYNQNTGLIFSLSTTDISSYPPNSFTYDYHFQFNNGSLTLWNYALVVSGPTAPFDQGARTTNNTLAPPNAIDEIAVVNGTTLMNMLNNPGTWTAGVPINSAPGPIAGAGLPGLLAGFGAMLSWYRKRRAVAA